MYILLKIIFFKIFPKIVKKEIGRYLLINCLSFFLRNGIMLDLFQISGYLDFDELLNKIMNDFVSDLSIIGQ